MSTGKGGETPPVMNRLPRGYYDEMASLLWDIGKLTIGSDFDELQYAPARVRSPMLTMPGHAMELNYTFRRNPITEAAEATHYKATISEIEHNHIVDSAEVWTWRSFELDVLRRRRSYSSGISILHGEVEIELLDDRSYLIGADRLERHVRDNARVARTDFSLEDVHWFVNGLYGFYNHLKEQAE